MIVERDWQIPGLGKYSEDYEVKACLGAFCVSFVLFYHQNGP